MSSSRLTLSIVLLLALGARITALWIYRADLDSDPDAYVGLSQSLVSGNGFATPETERPTAFRPPVYPLLIAGPRKLGLSAPSAVILIHLLSGLMTVFFTWRIARRRFPGLIFPTLTALLVAFDPLLLRYTATPMTEVVSAALCAMAVWFVLESVEPRGATAFLQPRPKLHRFAVPGIVLGVAILCRPVFAAVAVCWLAMGLIESCRQKWSGHIYGWLVTAGVIGLVWLPWIERNRQVFNTMIPLTTHGGYTLLLANNDTFYDEVVLRAGHPVWTEESLTTWQAVIAEQVKNSGITPANEPGADQWHREQAVETIRRRPNAFARAVLLRWQRFFALSPTNPTPSELGFVTWATRIFYGFLFVALAWSLVSSRRRLRADRFLWLVLLAFLLIHSIYWTNTRMRAPVVPVVVVLSMGGVERMMSQIKRRTGGSSAGQ